MAKVKLCATVDSSVLAYVMGVAKQSFQGNSSAALEWIVRSRDPKFFYEQSAREAARQLCHFREVLQSLEELKDEKEEIRQNLMTERPGGYV